MISAGTSVEQGSMATAASFVKLLRQLFDAKDDYRSGALDISWDGGRATLYVVFGQPNHAVYHNADGERLEGPEALSALIHHLPGRFKVAAWRKEVVREESLTMSMEELVEPFAQLAGTPSPFAEAAEDPLLDNASAAIDDDRGPVLVRLETFPMLPVGQSLWSDASARVVHLDVLAPKLPTSLIVLTGTTVRAAAVVVQGSVIDAVWVDEREAAAGESAAIAMMGARDGTISGYRLENATIAEAITMLWRCPVAHSNLELEWLDGKRLINALENDHLDRVISIDTAQGQAIGLFMGGRFVGGYTDAERQPSLSLEPLQRLLAVGTGRLTIRQRAADQAPRHLQDEGTYHLSVDAPTTPPGPAAGPAVVESFTPEELEAASRERPTGAVAEAAAWLRGAQGSEAAVAEGPSAVATAKSASTFSSGAQGMVDAAARELDFESIKADLIEIGVRWLGAEDAAPVTVSLQGARHRVDDIVATIEIVRGTNVPGHDASVVRAMAREMHYHAAEALSGA